MTEQEFVKKFTDHCIKLCGFTEFSDGTSVKDYCADAGKNYFADEDYRDEGPEECASSDISC